MRITPNLPEIPPFPADAAAAKQLLVDIIATGGGSYTGKTKLHKAFWLSHLYYWRENGKMLTAYPVVRMPHGPGIHHADDLIRELVQEGAVQIDERPNGPFTEYVYTLLEPHEIDPTNARHSAVRKAVEFLAPLTASAASAWAHEFSREWNAKPDGEILSIYLDLVTDERFAEMEIHLSAAQGAIGEIFG